MSKWADPDEWRKLYSGEECPIYEFSRVEGTCRGTKVELGTGYLTTQRDQAVRGYCCLVLNLEIHGNTIPHVHVHSFPCYVGDRFESGPIDLRGPLLPELTAQELEEFAARLRAALAGA